MTDWEKRARELTIESDSSDDNALDIARALKLGREMSDKRAEEIAQAIDRMQCNFIQVGALEAAARVARSFMSKHEPDQRTREQVLTQALREIAYRCSFAGGPDGAMPWTIARRALEWTP